MSAGDVILLSAMRAKDKVVEVINGAKVKFKTKDPVNCIKEVLAEYRVPKIGGIPPLTGGFVGYFGYDFVQYCEPSLQFDPTKATDFPDFDLPVIIFTCPNAKGK